jgi:hypothetical protein
MNYPITISFLLLVSGSIAGAQSASPAHGERTCSSQTLFGDYGVKIEGTLLGPKWPLRTLALFHFDGRENLTSRSYVVLNGVSTTVDWSSKAPGTYRVKPDCTGSATIEEAPEPIRFHFVLTNGGRQFYLVVDGDAIIGEGRKVN